MTNNLSNYQKDVFIDIYKTALGAMLSSQQTLDSIIINDVIEESTKIAMLTMDLLTDENGMRKPSDIIQDLQNRRRDTLIEFPKIEELKEY